MIVGKEQFILVWTYCSSTCLPPAQHLLCFFRLNSQASSASAAKLSQSQSYKDWQKGDSGRKAASFLLCQIHIDASGRSREGTKGAFCIREAEGLGRRHLWAGRGKPWGRRLRVDPGEQLCFCADWGKPRANKQELSPFCEKDDSSLLWPVVCGLWEGKNTEISCWGRSCVSEHANLGEKEQVLQKRCDVVGMWDACGPLKSSAQQREQPRLFCQNCEKLQNCL